MIRTRSTFWLLTLSAMRDPAELLRLLRVLALLGLCLLPMQMRAGSPQPHPHALLHLILDARDGLVDHHANRNPQQPTAQYHADHAPGHASSRPDIPVFGDSLNAGGGLAVLAVLLTALVVPPPGVRSIWPRLADWRDHVPMLEPPPPRHAFA